MGSELLQVVIEWKSRAGIAHWQGREPMLAKVGQKNKELVGVGRIGFTWDFSPTVLPFFPLTSSKKKNHDKASAALWLKPCAGAISARVVAR